MMMLSGPVIPPKSGEPRQLVVLLHGWGADGNDLIGLAPTLQPALPHARFTSPNAPDPCDQNPMGRQWYSFTDDRLERLKQSYDRAADLINAYLDTELERLKLDDSRLALVGFSQGCMMALYVALRREKAIAGVVGYSGMLIDEENLETDIRSRPPVLLCHGDQDPVVPYASLQAAVSGLAAHDVPAQWHTSPGVGHGIDPGALEAASRFLVNAFKEAARAAS
ncbi:MAG: alpha/beta fold hydrolase [Rhodospirillaceae bacterium]|nr:alpha/beta fold hydrolase [Rhodospirillaceae bacterium]MBT6204716.1 alpha/beta fold hydrolase [Rhodospirillaceae bacterium]MBT6512382.1 alpha/beta fold hydrolase [Rhodospirillaceae bacterium]MBT7646941.1 alpha/beta fold hydrolase [Rhodospirillaceae bacterium]